MLTCGQPGAANACGHSAEGDREPIRLHRGLQARQAPPQREAIFRATHRLGPGARRPPWHDRRFRQCNPHQQHCLCSSQR